MPQQDPDEHERQRRAVLALAERCDFEREHTMQVTRLALNLFDELRDEHGLDSEARETLEYGALLHDIGWIEGQKGHHKTAMRLILNADELELDERRRNMVAAVARYHRKALPGDRHPLFAAMDAVDKETVRILAGILRVADGLDRTHSGVVERIRCEVEPEETVLQCKVEGNAEAEEWAALRKADLLESFLDRRIRIDMMET